MDGGDGGGHGPLLGRPERLRKMGYERFLAAVRRELPRWGGKLVRHSVVKAVWDALGRRRGRAGAAAAARWSAWSC